MPSEVWNVRLLGGFRIEAPSGAEILIVSRKAKALVALLALNDGLAITRESLGSYLWPDKPRESQQQNLRQAVKDVRRAFGPVDALDATRDVCRLALENFICDAAECLRSGKDAGNLTLLPEMPEPVFDSYRNELAAYVPTGELGEAVRSASALLEWFLARDPARVLEMLHSCRDFIPSIPLPQLEMALRTGLADSSPSERLRSWASGQFAVVLMWAGRYDESLAVAKAALNASLPETDPLSWTNAACSAAVAMILRAKFEAARKLLDRAISIAESLGLRGEVNLLKHGHALRIFHTGNFNGALVVLDALEPSPLSEAHYAVGLALVGRVVEARERLKSARSMVDDEPSTIFKSEIGVAEGCILIAEGRMEDARAVLEPLVPFCEAHGLRLIGIHALEGLALVEPVEADAQTTFKRALVLRDRYGMPLLPSDRIRLARLGA